MVDVDSSFSSFAELAEHLPDYMSVIDEGLAVLFTNYRPRYEGHLTREQLMATTVDIFFPEDRREEIRREVAALFAGGAPVQFDSTSPDGATHWSTRIVRFSGDGAKKRALMVATDVTAEVTARAELEESKRRLARALAVESEVMRAHAMETLGRLAGGAAHDFNNLLMVIQTQVDFAREEQAAGRPCLDELSDIAAAAERASSLTQQLLAIARHDEATPGPVTLSSLLSDLRPSLLTGLPAPIDMRLEQRCDGTIVVDPSQLEQAVLNLCLSVVDVLGDDKTVQLVVDRETLDDGDDRLVQHRLDPGPYLTITVTAPGVPSPGRGTREPAPGLGWAVVRGLVQAQRGFATATPEVFGYTIFFPERQPKAGPTRTLLVAEDEEMVRTVLGRTLQLAGYRVLFAGDGVEALERHAAAEGGIDLVILDAVMPRLGGREAFLALREKDPELPVLFCSGYAADTLSGGLLEEGKVELLHKPVARDVLLSAVTRLLAGAA